MSYRRRLMAERRLLRSPSARPLPILSDNHKTGTSINLPVLNCKPTRRCATACYACVGPISWGNSIRKALAVDAVLRSGEIEGLVWECRRLRDVRLNGSGDMTMEHVPAILRLAEACPETVLWGFTRRREVAEAINRHRPNLSLIVSFDATSPQGELEGYDGALAYGPRRPRDTVPDDPRILTVFPEHHIGHTVRGVPLHPKDCPATRGAERLMACARCRRCWRPFEGIRDRPKKEAAVYPEIWKPRDEAPTFPTSCPSCGAPRISGSEPGETTYRAKVRYGCGGGYELKTQIQTHTDKWWGQCGGKQWG